MSRTTFLALLFLALGASTTRAQDGWLLFRGDAQRTGATAKQKTWDKRVAWRRPLLMDKLKKIEGFPESDADPDEAVDALIRKLRKDGDPPILPGSFPLIVNDFCIYRTHRGLTAAAMQRYTEVDEQNKEWVHLPSEIVWKSIPDDRSLVNLYDKERWSDKERWKDSMPEVVKFLQAQKQTHLLWANPMIGAINAGEDIIYSISDVPFVQDNALPGKLSRLFPGNGLCAYDSISGKMVWDLDTLAEPIPEFKETYFLGSPLPLNKKIFVLNEKAGELRLALLDPINTKLWKDSPKPTLEKSLTLLKIPDAGRAGKNLLRRTQPLHIASVDDDLLVCPTNAGVIFGVEGPIMTVCWQYRYRAEKTSLPKLPFWQAACPIMTKDRVVFTAADAPEVHCLDLNGKKKWTAAPKDDLYLATVHEGLVLLVGKSHCRALSLKDGTERWKLKMGHPAGVGVVDGSSYYVPIMDDPKGPAIWEIDIAKGKKLRRIAMPYPDALGNLALHRGMLVSQSVTHIAAFPLEAK